VCKLLFIKLTLSGEGFGDGGTTYVGGGGGRGEGTASRGMPQCIAILCIFDDI